MTVDVYSTEHCPTGALCESCGTADRKLATATATTSVGVLCLTLCGPCALAGQTPRMSAGTAARFVGTHCTHLGIDLDQMAEVLDVER